MDIYPTLLGASFVTLIVLFGIAIVTLVMAYLIISLLSTFMEPFRGVSTKHLDAYLAWFKWCRTFMATDSGTAERTVARQLANGVCRSRIRDMFNILPPYMDYWVASAA